MNRQRLLLKLQKEQEELYNYLRSDSTISSILDNIEQAHPGEIYVLNRKIGAGIGSLGLDYILTCEFRFQ